MKYQILLEKPAAKFISRLPKNDKERVVRAIERLPFDGDIKQLRGQKSKSSFRCRKRARKFCVIRGSDDKYLMQKSCKGLGILINGMTSWTTLCFFDTILWKIEYSHVYVFS